MTLDVFIDMIAGKHLRSCADNLKGFVFKKKVGSKLYIASNSMTTFSAENGSRKSPLPWERESLDAN